MKKFYKSIFNSKDANDDEKGEMEEGYQKYRENEGGSPSIETVPMGTIASDNYSRY